MLDLYSASMVYNRNHIKSCRERAVEHPYETLGCQHNMPLLSIIYHFRGMVDPVACHGFDLHNNQHIIPGGNNIHLFFSPSPVCSPDTVSFCPQKVCCNLLGSPASFTMIHQSLCGGKCVQKRLNQRPYYDYLCAFPKKLQYVYKKL